ncbi:hypothetical protein PAXINDRAFT_92252 [Paxillus involutus ATCC 200175]|uniref:F-box domain-containing protein n=1 Tax=Paxillus involutus ATCC 200175 TaxID=664439 RepID=A0A0C9SUV2_PAXIN|nr:hypothetical protein PAXINDRAFT_92252 [Paxillus involutus ATCC 200175]
MHPFFLIPELTLHTISFLADDRPAGQHNASSRCPTNAREIARLAQTCKALSEPALDILWKTQHSLAPLVMCLPQDAWYLGGSGKTIVSTHKHVPQYAHLTFSPPHCSCHVSPAYLNPR